MNNTVKPRKPPIHNDSLKSVSYENVIRRKIYQIPDKPKLSTFLSLLVRLSEDVIKCSTRIFWCNRFINIIGRL